MFDPYILEMFMDNTSPRIGEVAHIAGLLVQNNFEMSSIIPNQPEKNYLKKCPKASKSLGKNSAKHNTSLIDKFINNCSSKEFYRRFGMTRSTMQELINFVTTRVEGKSEVLKYTEIPLDKRIHISINLLRTTGSFRKFVSKLRLSDNISLSNTFYQMCTEFASFKDEIIKFPDFKKQRLIKHQIAKKYKFPNCIGFIDRHTIYINQSRVTVEAICDHNLVFYYFNCNPEQSFTESELGRKLTEIVDHENHLLGSSQYPLLVNLMTPFEESANQTSYNKVHFKAWSNVQQAFEALKDKLRRLDVLKVTLNQVYDVLYAACFLHNFVRLSLLEDYDLDSCDDSLQISGDVNASDKRQLISETIQLVCD